MGKVRTIIPGDPGKAARLILINIDERTLQVLNEPGKKPESKSFMWLFRGGSPDRPTMLYQYHSLRIY
ncbi:MAG: transposase, partial [Pseudomonadota bacterium]